MNKIFQLLLTMFCIAGIMNTAYGERVPERYLTKNAQETKSTAAACNPGAGFEMLEVNNVRSRVNTSGDMWQNFATGIAQYFIPANDTKTSLFAGALWIGGTDVNGQLKLAAQRFRQLGVDYWPGPLSIDGTAAISDLECVEWDKMFHITKAEVEEFIGWNMSENPADEYPEYSIPASIKNWPAVNTDPTKAYYLAPFFDADGDGTYNPENGDYPYYDFDNALCPLNFVDSIGWEPQKTMGSAEFRMIDGRLQPNDRKTENGGILSDQVIKGDETYWWVFNDKGNSHGETKGQPIGLEIRAQAFGFATNDEINNMTFFSYEIINRSTFTLTNTYFAPWTDPDLGYAQDDYVGCDVERGMGYCYNGDDTDGTGEAWAYGKHPPAVGIDFFQGPYLDPDGYDNPGYKSKPIKGPSFLNETNPCEIVTGRNQLRTMYYGDSIPITTIVRAEAINGVNFGNGIKNDERFGMRRFVYHDNNNTNNGDPSTAPQYYLMLQGIWKNGARMTFGGNGTSGTIGTDFMFPDKTDPCHWGTGGTDPGFIWSEAKQNNKPDDRRFMQSAGPFTLYPGAVNYITFGVPWARATNGDNWASVVKLQEADDKCQALFDNCFKVLDGPDAPDLSFVELENRIIVHLTNGRMSNNFKEKYQEVDNTIVPNDSIPRDSLYRFEGYQVYQLARADIGPESLNDESKARLVAQYDLSNGVGRLVNFITDPVTGFDVPTLMVDGSDKGISHSFEITEDKFALGESRTLVNNKKYYYMAIAYAYNNFQTFDANNSAEGGQKKPYLAGRRNIKVGTALPHKIGNGIVLKSNYGDTPPITRISGKGNGGTWLEISDSLKMVLLQKPPLSNGVLYGNPDYPILYNPEYLPNHGPVKVQVIDPLNVKGKDYQIQFYDCTDTYNIMRSQKMMIDLTYAMYINKARWKLVDKETGKEYYPDTLISISHSDQRVDEIYTTINEQLFLGSGGNSNDNLGISIMMSQTLQPGDYWIRTRGNGYLGYEATFANPSIKWLSGIPDQDIPGSPLNWIRSGGYYETGASADPMNADYDVYNYSGHAPTDEEEQNRMMDAWDPMQNYEKIFNGTWAPYTLCATSGIQGSTLGPQIEQSPYGPAASKAHKNKNFMTSMGSVDIVITPDKSLWTRSVVIESGWNPPLNQDTALPFMPRKAPSVNKDGVAAAPGSQASTNPDDPNYISPTGMGWFPGYAINLDTGERLNIIFSENSYMSSQNGRDMLFNPTSTVIDNNGNIYMGGMHYVYIMGHKMIYYTNSANPNLSNGVEMPAYDAGQKYMDLYKSRDQFFIKNNRIYIFGSCMYVGMPIPTPGMENQWLDNAFTLKIRVAKPYARYSAEVLKNSSFPGGGIPIPTDPNYVAVNDEWPMYEFSTKSMAPVYNDPATAKSDVDLIAVVPNPYYAYSNYEQNATDNRVRITNLPKECTVTIYNVGGSMVRQFKKDDETTYFDWDLKNYAGVPIAGGTYIVHIKSPAGEKVIKWFGVIRTVDLFTF